MLKITLKRKKIDTAEYDRVTAGHFGIAMLQCYSCTEMQTGGCSHSIISDGLHYDRVTCICCSSLAINYDPKHVSTASVFLSVKLACLPSQAPVNSLIMQSIFALFHLTCAL
jgi:hypothetical protein